MGGKSTAPVFSTRPPLSRFYFFTFLGLFGVFLGGFSIKVSRDAGVIFFGCVSFWDWCFVSLRCLAPMAWFWRGKVSEGLGWGFLRWGFRLIERIFGSGWKFQNDTVPE